MSLDILDQLPTGVPAKEWEDFKKASNSREKVRLIRGQVDRRRQAAIKVYSQECSAEHLRAVAAMNALKGKSKLDLHQDRFFSLLLQM